MLYGGLIAITLLMLKLTKRHVGMALLMALAMITVGDLLANDLADLLLAAGLTLSKTLLLVIIKSLLVVLPLAIVLLRSSKRSRQLVQLAFETALVAGLIILVMHPLITNFVKIDQLSWQIWQLVSDNQKWLLVLAASYGFYQVMIKDEE